MRTALFSACYLEGVDSLGNDRLERNLAYLTWYRKLKSHMQFDAIVLADNQSPIEKVLALGPSRMFCEGSGSLPHDPNSDLWIYRYENHLGRVFSKEHGYIFCWRALYTIGWLFEKGFDRVIALDSDGYVTSGRFARWIGSLQNGWVSVWCPRHHFPESSIFVLCRDALPIYREFTARPYEEQVGRLMELVLPFTHVEKNFVCDRFGETTAPQPGDCDFYGQRRMSTPITFKED